MPGDLHIVLLIHLVKNGGCTAQGLVPEIDRSRSLQRADPVVIDDLQDSGLLEAVDGLGFLVMVHQDQFLAVHAQQIPSADDAHILSVFIQNREIAVPDRRHDLHGILQGQVQIKGQQPVLLHKVLDRSGHADDTGGREGIVGGSDDRTVTLPGLFQDPLRDLRVDTDDHAGGAQVDGDHLGLVAVGDQDDIPFADQADHGLGTRSDMDPSLMDMSHRITDQHFAFQGVEQVLVAGMGLAQNGRIEQVQIGVRDILDRDQALQTAVFCGHAERIQNIVPHILPRFPHAHVSVEAGRFTDINIPDLRPDIRQQLRGFHAEMVQDELGLPADIAGPFGQVLRIADLVLQPCVGNGGADGIRIRILMTDDKDRPGLFLGHGLADVAGGPFLSGTVCFRCCDRVFCFLCSFLHLRSVSFLHLNQCVFKLLSILIIKQNRRQGNKKRPVQ